MILVSVFIHLSLKVSPLVQLWKRGGWCYEIQLLWPTTQVVTLDIFRKHLSEHGSYRSHVVNVLSSEDICYCYLWSNGIMASIYLSEVDLTDSTAKLGMDASEDSRNIIRPNCFHLKTRR